MKVWIAAPLAMLVSANLMAAERIEHQVTVTAQIPTDTFYVQPTGGDNWMSTPQKLAYNPYTKKLDKLSKQLDAKNTLGPIKGYLSNPAVMASGGENIALTVKVGGVSLSTSSAEILTAADAKTGKLLGLEVIPADAPDAGYKPGNYQGVVNMIFEPGAPTGGA
ncbi:CS1 type fimbrial major subunit [Aeromonas salmonicida]|uniref:CS1 type fimbrial major subunit n=1 Tax=Aeromonas salmonicida TaxID=645 RepID=UPI00073B427B|nr:CS1 type fimbrial major subunit [Aeromonas salmonicida]KTA80627.1 adhesin [Aeromonas salmonicida]MDE7527637.1 fimbrial protein [Aeromonas salmonicida]MDE7531986.1 fimbrial protein [Aeromonas salmonicida]